DSTTATFTAGSLTGNTSVSVSSRAPSVWLVDQSSGSQIGSMESVNSSSGVSQFSNLLFTVSAGQTKTVLVRTNLDASALSNSNADRVKFDIADPANDVSARDPLGNTVALTDSAPNSTTADSGTRITVADTGSVSVALAPDDTESETGLVVAAKSNVVMAKFRFTAQNEEMKITKAQFSIALAALDEITGFSVWDGASLIAGPITPTLGAASGSAAFTNMTFIVPKDASKTMTVKANMNTTSAGADSGEAMTVTLDTANFEARGTSAGSSTVLTEAELTGDPLDANTKYFRKTVPTLSFALADTVLTGAPAFLNLTIAADSSEQVSFKQLKFVLSVSNATVTADSCQIQEGSNVYTEGSGLSAASSSASDTALVCVFSSEQTVPAGQAKTYKVSVGATVGSGSASISTKMDADALVSSQPDDAQTAMADSDSRFIWSDNAAIPHSEISADWFNGFKVKNLPSINISISKS
ncbi:MAG: hypothetical protein V3T88_00115, partial [Nitrosomonadaceae bacterium]